MSFLSKIAKRSLWALSFATVLNAAAPAQADYIGGGYLYALSGCSQAGWPRDMVMLRARYNPSEITRSNSTVTLDTAVGGTFSYTIRGAWSPSTTWRAAQGYSIWGEVYSSTPVPQIRVMQRWSAQTGNVTLPTSPDIRMTFRIRHFNGVRGCIVEARMMLRNSAARGLTN